MSTPGMPFAQQRRIAERLARPPQQGFVERRKGEVTDVDYATGLAMVQYTGEPDPTPFHRWSQSYRPRIGDWVWVDVWGKRDRMIIGPASIVLLDHPKCRIESDAIRTTTNGAAEKVFDFAGGSVALDTAGMADIANDRINIATPGKYLVGFSIKSEGQTGGGPRRVADVSINGSFAGSSVAVRSEFSSISGGQYHNACMPVDLGEDDYIQLGIFGGNAGEPNLNWGDANYLTKLFAIYQP